MDKCIEDIFTFRSSSYDPPSDYVIKHIEKIEDLGLSDKEAEELLLINFGFYHIVWN